MKADQGRDRLRGTIGMFMSLSSLEVSQHMCVAIATIYSTIDLFSFYLFRKKC